MVHSLYFAGDSRGVFKNVGMKGLIGELNNPRLDVDEFVELQNFKAVLVGINKTIVAVVWKKTKDAPDEPA